MIKPTKVLEVLVPYYLFGLVSLLTIANIFNRLTEVAPEVRASQHVFINMILNTREDIINSLFIAE